MDMRRLIPYAGYDPSEDRADYRVGRRWSKVDPRRALELRADGMGWRDVADALTCETDRNIRFATDAVISAVRRYRQQQKETRT